MTNSICKFEKCGRFIRLYDFNNDDIEDTAEKQKITIRLYHIRDSIKKVKKNCFLFNGTFMSSTNNKQLSNLTVKNNKSDYI